VSIRVVCINKDNGDHDDPHESIDFFGWINESTQAKGKSSRKEMVDFLEDKGQAYVKDNQNHTSYCYVRTNPRNGNKFIQTVSDGRYTNNLLSLMECR